MAAFWYHVTMAITTQTHQDMFLKPESGLKVRSQTGISMARVAFPGDPPPTPHHRLEMGGKGKRRVSGVCCRGPPQSLFSNSWVINKIFRIKVSCAILFAHIPEASCIRQSYYKPT